MLIDSHCHLDFSQFDRDRDEVLQRARDAGVGIIVNPGYDLDSSRRAVELAERYSELYAAVGIHPHQAKTVTDGVIADLRGLARHPRVVAIGEIGLDFYRDLSPRRVQRRAFERQLELARELALPVIVHSRDAHADVLSTLRQHGELPGSGPQLRGVLHAFSGDLDLAEGAIELGFCLGIAGPVTFAKADRLRAVAAELPRDRILVETDAPYLTPHPHRGKRNEPAYVGLVAAAVAAVRGQPARVLEQQVWENGRRLLGV